MYNIGDIVKIKGSNILGKIKNINFKRNNIVYSLEINNKLVKIHENSIEEKINKEKVENFRTSYNNQNDNNVKISFSTLNHTFNNELMLRHKTLDIAMFELEEFINDAILNKVYEVRIVHGKNGGILRNGVHEYLKKCNKVESFKLAGYFEGQYGVTIVKLKRS